MRDKFLSIILLVSLISILGYIRSLIFLDISSLIFHTAYIISIVSISLLLVIKDSATSSHTRLLFVLAWTWTLMMTIPFRLPEGIISNYPDMNYESQIINNIIASSGIGFRTATIYGQGYAAYPALELLITEVSIVSGVDHEIILKYAGPFLGLLTITFLYCFYRSFLSEKDATISVFLSSSCFHFLTFCAHTVHLSLALMYFTLMLYSLTKVTNTRWRIIPVLSISAIVLTHHFTSIVGVFYLIAANITVFVLAFLFKKRIVTERIISFRITLLFAILTFSWLSYTAFSYFNRIVQLFEVVILTLTSIGSEISTPLIAEKTVHTPILIRFIGDLGIVIFGLAVMIGFLYVILNKKMFLKCGYILPFASASALIFIAGILIYSKYAEMTDLLPRAFVYVYFSAAPLSLLAVKRMTNFVSSHVHRKLLCAFLISLMSVSAVYYYCQYYRYDNTAPLDIEDVRFPLYEWKCAGLFARNCIVRGAEIWGDKIAFNFIGSYGEVDVKMLPKGQNITLTNWVSIYPSSNSMIILRKSMLNVSYLDYHVDEEGLNKILENNNVFYTSGEIVVLKKR